MVLIDIGFEKRIESKALEAIEESAYFFIAGTIDIGGKRLAVGFESIAESKQRFEHTRSRTRSGYELEYGIALLAVLVDSGIFGGFFFG